MSLPRIKLKHYNFSSERLLISWGWGEECEVCRRSWTWAMETLVSDGIPSLQGCHRVLSARLRLRGSGDQFLWWVTFSVICTAFLNECSMKSLPKPLFHSGRLAKLSAILVSPLFVSWVIRDGNLGDHCLLTSGFMFKEADVKQNCNQGPDPHFLTLCLVNN